MAIDDLEFSPCYASPPPPPPAKCSGYCKVAARDIACSSPKCTGCPFCRMLASSPHQDKAGSIASTEPLHMSTNPGQTTIASGGGSRACCSFDHCNTCPVSPYCSTGARCEHAVEGAPSPKAAVGGD
eukprot:scaffold276336_cov40-Tisochrysis_lutea.AAC.3